MEVIVVTVDMLVLRGVEAALQMAEKRFLKKIKSKTFNEKLLW